MTLAALPAMTPDRLRSLLHGRRPSESVAAIRAWASAAPTARSRSGPLDALFASVSTRSGGRSLGEIWLGTLEQAACHAEKMMTALDVDPRIDVRILGHEGYPRVLAADPRAPAVLFLQGHHCALENPRVGIVGTRHATAHGRAFARRLGDELSAHGISVVSGLARGIDVHAHHGVLDRLRACGPERDERPGLPIGVVASGLDVVYPPEHDEMWRAVAENGLLMSESLPGTEPHAFRFPLRNRIIAAMCNVLVVVESRATGGSMITVREALARGVTVMAVPGSTSTRSAQGTNQLIRDGASIVVEPEDVLAVLGLESHRREPDFDLRPRPSVQDEELLDVIGCEPMTLDHVVEASHRSLADVALALGRLEANGWLMCTAGWFERVEFAHI